MSATIQVRCEQSGDPQEFAVTVRENQSETRHRVTMSLEACRRLSGGLHTPEAVIDAAFRFLVDREPKESILPRFDISVISRYFPDFERELPRYLAAEKVSGRALASRSKN